MVLEKFPRGNFHPKNSHSSNFPLENPPGKLPPRKFSPRIFPPISLIAFLHLILRFTNLKTSALLKHYKTVF